jgi:hypothetical protein
VEVDAVVEARLAQVHEVAAGDGELVHEDLGDERALRRFFFLYVYGQSVRLGEARSKRFDEIFPTRGNKGDDRSTRSDGW